MLSSGIIPGIFWIIANSRLICATQYKRMAWRLEISKKLQPFSIIMQGAKILLKTPQIVCKGFLSRYLKLRAHAIKMNKAMNGRDRTLA